MKDHLEKSEKHFRLLSENISDLMVLTAPDGKRLYASPSVTTVFGFDVEEYMAFNAWELIHPDDLKMIMAKGGPNERVKKGEDAKPLRYRAKHKNGGYVWVEATSRSSVDEFGGIIIQSVILTASATILGLIPLAVGLNIDFVKLLTELNPHIFFGGDSVTFWGPLSWTMIYGLGFATFLTLIFKDRYKYFGILIFSWAAIVSYSRIYLGAHYPADIVCGAMFGILIGYLTGKIFHMFHVNVGENLEQTLS